MKTVRYLQGMGEPRGPGIKTGDVLTVSDEEAERLIAKHIAVEYDGTEGEAPITATLAVTEPYSGYDGAKGREVVERIESGDLTLVELVNLRQAEELGDERDAVLDAVDERLDVAAAALEPTVVDVPDGVVPGETPGWPVINGEVVDLPDEVREELAKVKLESEEETVAETTSSSAAEEAKTASSPKAAGAKSATSKKAGRAKNKKSTRAARAKKRS